MDTEAMDIMVIMAMEVIMARERLRLKLDIMDTVDTADMVMDMVTEAMDMVITMAREMLRLKLVIMDMVTEATDMVITMAREMLRLVIMVVTEAMDIMDIMVTEAMDMVIMDKSKVSFIQTVLSSESELRII